MTEHVQDRDWKVIDEECGCCTRVEVDGEVLFYIATEEKVALAEKLTAK